MIVIKANTVKEWRAILDYYFAQGYQWEYFSQSYFEYNFKRGRQLIFEKDKTIRWATRGMFRETITYAELMARRGTTCQN